MKDFDITADQPTVVDSAPTSGSEQPGSRSAGGTARRSVRTKLMRLALVVTAVAVCLAGGAMVTYDLSVYRASWVTDLASQASILGVSAGPALEFEDHELAARILAAMGVRPNVLIAALYTSSGSVYAAYARDSQSTPPASAPPPGVYVAGERVEVCRAIERNGEKLGTIYMRARYDVRSRVEAYTGIFCLIMALSLAVSYVLARSLQRAITDPLEAMTGIARQIVARRDYSLRATKTTNDEIGIAVLAFNGMLDEVESRARTSEAANTALQFEVTVRHAAEAALRDADRRKDEFLATLAHELRNPLAPIRNAVRLLETDGTAEQQRWSRAVIARQVHRMALLLDDLLDVSRITRGLLHLKLDVVELRSVVRDALEVARPLIDAKRQQLSVTLPDDPVVLTCDQLRLSQALSNLLTNAAKYTDENGRLALTVTLDDEELSLSVRDSGIGIDPRAIPGLFQIFSQLDSALDRAEGGLGIGLALVKGLVELHGGSVEVASAGVGMGSEFTIRLPRSAVAVKTEPAPTVGVVAHDPGPTPLTVLLADDNRDGCDSMGMVLELMGFDVVTAYGGREALSMAERLRPAVALLDIGMGDMNGYEVARSIRREAWGAAVYLIAITGWGQTNDKTRALAAGFDRHLTKPVDPDQLQRILRELAGQRGVREVRG